MGMIRSTGELAFAPRHVIASAIDALLHNWARWAGGLSSGPGSSSTWRFAGRGNRAASYDNVSVVVPVDTDQARQVEAVVCNAGFSPRMRSLLQAHYVARTHPLRTCRELGLHQDSYDEWVWRASVYFQSRWTERHIVQSAY